MPDPFQLPNDVRSLVLSYLPTPERMAVRAVSRAAHAAREPITLLRQRFQRDRNALVAGLAALQVEQAAYLVATGPIIAPPGSHPHQQHYINMGRDILGRVDRLEEIRARTRAAFTALRPVLPNAPVPVPAPLPPDLSALRHQLDGMQLTITTLRGQVQARLTEVEDAVNPELAAFLQVQQLI